MTPGLEKRFEEIESIAKGMGLDPFPVIFEEVPRETIWDVASYGLPLRMGHWSFGRSFLHQKLHGEMGFSKIYELIINNNPSIAFLDETNSEATNLLIAAHCYGHSSFFKHNLLFAPTNRNMVNQAEANARQIDSFKEKYGVDEVENWMDIGFALDAHIDPRLGENRLKYPPPAHSYHEIKPLPFADLWGESTKPHVIEKTGDFRLPPHPERDILWFLINYAPLLPWQREVLTLIRSEAFYFFPQGQTKIANEGFASFFHAEIMLNYWNLKPEEHLEFSHSHSNIVRPGGGGSLNPYYVGFRIFGDIRKRWDKAFEAGKNDPEFQASKSVEVFDDKGNIVKSKIDGMAKILKVRNEDDDVSFISNYLTRELAEDMKLFVYGQDGDSEDPDDDDIIIKDRQFDAVKDALVGRLHNNGAPPVRVMRADESGLYLRHDHSDPLPLDKRYTGETLKYIYAAWKRPVFLETRDADGEPVTYQVTSKGGAFKAKSDEGETMVKVRI